MSVSNLPACPRCAAPVQPDWDWCQKCGYDPDDLRSVTSQHHAREPQPARPPPPVAPPEPTAERPSPSPPSSDPDEARTVRLSVVLGVLIVVAVAFFVYLLVRDDNGASTRRALDIPSDWVMFEAADRSLSAQFPQPPMEDEQGLALEGGGAVDVSMYLDENADWSFVIMASDAGAGIEIDLARVVGGMALDVGGTVVAETPTEFLGADAVDVTIEAPGKTWYGTAAIVDGRVVVVEHGAQDPDRDDFERFRDSVVLQPG